MIRLQVIYEDNHLIAVNKPAGVLVQGDETGDIPMSDIVKKYIKDRYNKPGDVFLGVIHRIDRPVSGVVIFARTSKALERMSQLFRDREIEKTYWAITSQRPEPLEGHLKHFILKDKTKNQAKAYDRMSNRAKDAKEADLDYKMLAQIGSHVLLEVKPQTGRPHQIRVQLATIGCPIRGDVKYGFPVGNDDGSICLHCRSLSFVHPVKKERVTITADPPETMFWNYFSAFQ